MKYGNYVKKMKVLLKTESTEIKFDDVDLAKDGKYNSGDFFLITKAGNTFEIELKKNDGSEFEIKTLKYIFLSNLKNFSKLVVPDCGRYYHRYFIPLLSWGIKRKMVGGNYATPFAAFMNHFNEVELAVGIVGEPAETAFLISSPGRTSKNTLAVFDGKLVFEIERPINGFSMGKMKSLKESLYLAEKGKTWFHALKEYAKEYYKVYPPKFEIQDNAYNPTWCSWVPWNSDDLTSELIIKQAQQCKELGIKSLIIDDGWFGPGCDSEQMDSSMGDWNPDHKKFPDMENVAKKIKELGIEPIIWMAPLAVSPAAQEKPAVEHLLMKNDDGLWIGPNKFHNFCPSNPEARKMVLKKTRKLLDMGFDGIKADLYNNISETPCKADHEHDCHSTTKGIMTLMKELWEDLKVYKPHAIMEIKVNYANMRAAQYGSMTRGGDSPYDNINNFYNLAYLRAYTPVVHNDYLSWTVDEKDRDLAILIMKMITLGVPTFSVDLTALPEAQRRVIKNWLKFYKSHLDVLKNGNYEPQTGELYVWQIETKNEGLYSVLNESREVVLKAKKKITVMNGTGFSEIYARIDKKTKYKMTVRDHYLKPVIEKNMFVTDKIILEIPVGGSAEFEKIKA